MPGRIHALHHSKDLREGDKNHGENLVLWDLLFGTFFREPRRPPVDVGIKKAMPARFAAQPLWPFRPKTLQDGTIPSPDVEMMRSATPSV